MSVFDFKWRKKNEAVEIGTNGSSRAGSRPLLIAPSAKLPSGPYTSSDDHLWDEQRRIDQLVRAQTLRWRLTIGESKPEHLWGMVHVTDAEIDDYLQSPFIPPQAIPSDLADSLSGYWQAAAAAAQAIQARRDQTAPDLLLRLDRLQAIFGLSDFERDVLLVCLLPDLDGRYRRLYGYLQDDVSRTSAGVELVLQILYPFAPATDMGRSAFDAASPLIAHHLLLIERPWQSGDALSMRAVRVDDRISGYLLGNDTVDGRLRDMLSRPAAGNRWEHLIAPEEIISRLQSIAAWQRQDGLNGAALFLHGPYGGGRLKAANALTTAIGVPLLVIDAEKAQRCPCGWEQAVDLAYREARLSGAALYWAGCELLLDEEQQKYLWSYLVSAAEGYPGMTIMASQTAWDPAGNFQKRPFLRLDFPMPEYALRRRLWETLLPPEDLFALPVPDLEMVAEMLANGFQLTEGQMVDALTTAYGRAARRAPQYPRLTIEDIYTGCRLQSGRRLITMARRVEPRTELTFDELILPKANWRQLDELRARIRHRSWVYSGLGFEQRLSLGKGLIALFTGSSGTGKTMAAELLARERGVDLYKVDLSAVVSKYVGDTEKNLSRVFGEAEDANAIIFFDEADALFGKRGEVKEARDRWANIEINYLLQRVEEYAGVVILATNLRQNIDEAFMRRIHVIVEFPFPTKEARFHIWRGMFPTGLGRPPDAEVQDLANRFRLPGGSIKNVVIDAAFRALAENEGERPDITLRHLALGTAREYQKLGKPITRREFGELFHEWIARDIL